MQQDVRLCFFSFFQPFKAFQRFFFLTGGCIDMAQWTQSFQRTTRQLMVMLQITNSLFIFPDRKINQPRPSNALR